VQSDEKDTQEDVFGVQDKQGKPPTQDIKLAAKNEETPNDNKSQKEDDASNQDNTQQTQDQQGQVDCDSDGDGSSLESHKYPFIICPSEWGIDNNSSNIVNNRDYLLGEKYSRSLQFSSEA